MIKTWARLAAIACALGAANAYAGDVSVGVTISGEIQPGVYGTIELGNRPPPPVVYAQPVWIQQPPPRVYVAPVYMHVPPGHAKNWRRYCGRYHACDRPVYFVRSSEYGPPPPPRGPGRDDDRGPGRGNGHGHGHGKH